MLHKLLALSRIKAPPHPTSSFPSADSRPLQLRRYSAHRGCHLPVKVFGTCLAPCRDSTTAALLPRPGTFLAQHRELPPAGSQPRPLRADGGGVLAATPGRLLGWAGPGGPAPGLFSARHGQPRSATGGAARHGTARDRTAQLGTGRERAASALERHWGRGGAAKPLGTSRSLPPGAGQGCCQLRAGGAGRGAQPSPCPAEERGHRLRELGEERQQRERPRPVSERGPGGGAGTGTGTGGVLGPGAVRGMGTGMGMEPGTGMGPGLGLGLGLVPGHPGSPGLGGSAACRPETLKQLSSRQTSAPRERSREGLAGLGSDEGDVPGC